MKRQGLLIGTMFMASMAGGAVSNLWLEAQLGAQGADVVTASQVNIVDGNGRLRLVMAGEDERGLASLAFYGVDGIFRGAVGAEADGDPVLQFNNRTGASRLSMTVQGDDGIVTVGNEGAGHVLTASLNGRPIVGLSDGGRTPLRLTLGQQGQPQVSLLNGAGRTSLGLVVGEDDAPFLSIFDGAGAQRVAIGTVADSTLINLMDGSGPRLVLGVAEDGRASVSFYDEEGALEHVVSADDR